MSNEDIKNDIAKTMLSAAHELSLYIADANEGLRKKVDIQTETEPDWHDTQTCYELAQDSKRVEAMALRIKELEVALKSVCDEAMTVCGNPDYSDDNQIIGVYETALESSKTLKDCEL